MRSSWPIRRRAIAASRAMRARESERAASPQAPFAHSSHYTKLQVDHALEADQDADLDFIVGRSKAPVPRDNH